MLCCCLVFLCCVVDRYTRVEYAAFHAVGTSSYANPGSCTAAVAGIRVTASGRLVSSVCPTMGGISCVAPLTLTHTLPNGMKYYLVAESLDAWPK